MLNRALSTLSLCLLMGCPAPPAAPVATPAPTPSPSPSPTPVPPPPVVADLHVDTVTMMLRNESTWDAPELEASFGKLLEGGVNTVVQGLWIERGVEDPMGRAVQKVKRMRTAMLQSRRRAAIVTTPDQLEIVLKEGRVAVILALEGGTPAQGSIDNLKELRRLGVSMMGLTWSESSPLADSSADVRSPSGLTALGREAVAWCNDAGVMIDVSHMSDAATRQTVELSRAPVLASHSNARATCDVPRNLPDDLMKAVAGTGGLLGVMFHGPFVVAGRDASRHDVAAMTKAMVDRVGARHVGIGSDWDGIIKSPAGLEDATTLPLLLEDLRGMGIPAEDVAAISGGNFLRLWKEVWAGRKQGP